MMSSSEYSFLESECSFTKYVLSCPNTKYNVFVSTVTVFDNEGVSDNSISGEVQYGCIKRGKLKRLDACYM